MSRSTRRTEEELADLHVLTDGESAVDFFADTVGRGKGGRQPGKGSRPKAAWQRVDERKEAQLLRAQLEDWEDWDPSRPDEPLWGPRPE